MEYCFYNSTHVGRAGFAAAHEPTCVDKNRFNLTDLPQLRNYATRQPFTPFPRHNVEDDWGGVGNVEDEWGTVGNGVGNV